MAIIKLDKDTVEKIAAGEVIESPLSIIKELVENSIDAKSKNITVEIKNGGKSFIRVTDDGIGIGNDEIELAFQKHATSKISSFDDLYTIASLGFRGEALPSIASVSKVVAISKTKDSDVGIKLDLRDNLTNKTSIATNKGTSIIVKDLFYNIPARRKFLKSDIAEGNKINKLMYAFAIGNKDISFKYIKDDRVQFHSNPNLSLKISIADILDNLLEENLIEINADNDSYKIRGEIGLPSYYRGNRSMQYIFVNDRYVEDQEITKVIEESYQGLIPPNRYPVFFIFIYTNPKNIDVNIHPNKKYIKYSYENDLLDLVSSNISKLLKSENKISNIGPREEKSEEILDFTDYKAILDKYSPSEFLVKENNNKYNNKSEETNFFDKNEDIDFSFLDQSEGNKDTIIEETYIEEVNLPLYKTSIFRRYSIFEDGDKAYILDHRIAEEKLNMSKFIRDLRSKDIDKQRLLNPIRISLNKGDFDKYESKKDIFSKLGFDIEPISESSLIIRELPYIFDIPENDRFFYDLLDIDLDDNEEILFTKLRGMVKSFSFKKGDKINEEEAIELYKKLMKEDNPYKNYDGRPTIISLLDKDLEKYFER